MKKTEHRFAETLTELGRVGSSWTKNFVAHFDWTLLITVFAICGIGLANLYSATEGTAHSGKFDSQLVWVGLGMVVLLGVGYIDYRGLLRIVWPSLLITIVVLAAMRLFSEADDLGVRRWLRLGPFRIQPSELAKLVVILGVARFFQSVSDGELKPRWRVLAAVGIVAPVILVAAQPDLGTAVLIGLLIASVSLCCMKKLWPFFALFLPGLFVMAPVLWSRMHDYQKRRVLSFLDPTADPLGSGWQTQQSIVAVGSGRITGKGYMEATQNQFNFLPEYWTDFPFSVFSEEWGFLGSVGLLGLMAWLVLWILHVALNARDTFGTAISLGVAAMVFWHVVINTSMVLGLAPVVGLTFPLISYGGSSLLTFMVGLALVSSISSRS